MSFHFTLASSWPDSYLIILCFVFFIRLWYLKMIKNKVIAHWPIVDMLPSLIKNAHRVHDWTVDISNTYGGTRFERGPIFGRIDMVYTSDPKNIEYILKTNFLNFPKGSDYKEAFDIFGDGVFNVDFESWHSQRNMARMKFISKKVRLNIATMTHKVVQDALLPLLAHVSKESLVVDLQDVFLRYTFDTSIYVIFGRNPSYLSVSFPPDELAKAIDDSAEALFYRHIVPSIWWKFCRKWMIGNEKKMDRACKTIDQHLTRYIVEKREDMAKGVEGSDLLQAYMSFTDAEKDDILYMSSDKFLRDSMFTFLIAGRDTTATALSWFFWLVSKNSRVEANILEELKLVYSKNKKEEDGPSIKRPWVFDKDSLTSMMYLHAALCEALRLYPSLPLIRRGIVKQDVLPDGTVVKPGVMIMLSKYAAARMERVWGKDCSEFIPERWIDKSGTKLNHETMSQLLAFGIGPRICLGKDTAFVMMKSAASSMLFNFHIEVVEGQNIQPKPSVVLKMKNGMMIRVKERIL